MLSLCGCLVLYLDGVHLKIYCVLFNSITFWTFSRNSTKTFVNMAMSGVELDASVKVIFDEVQSKKKHRYVTFHISEGKIRIDKVSKQSQWISHYIFCTLQAGGITFSNASLQTSNASLQAKKSHKSLKTEIRGLSARLHRFYRNLLPAVCRLPFFN